MKVLVTGATGLLGSHIVERLVAQGYQVRPLARRTSDIGHLRSTGVEIVFVEMWSKLVRARQMPYLNRASLGHLKIEILLDVSKVRKELGWEPKVSLDEGVRLYVEWRRRQKKG